TSNFALDTGGAILFGTLPMDSSVLAQTGSLTILNSQFYQNCTAGLGGAVSTGFVTTIRDSLFSQNRADAEGSCLLGLASQAGTQAPANGRAPQALDPSFIGIGGAIYNAGTLSVAGTTFVSNTATLTATAGGGGAIHNGIGAVFDLRSSTLTGNTAQQDGGAIYIGFAARATVIGSSFTHNLAISRTGGAITNHGDLTVTQTLFVSNGGAPGGGGAISSDVGLLAALEPAGPNGPGGPAPRQTPTGVDPPQALHVANSTFVANTSEYEGGAIDTGKADIMASTFTSNTAAFGGAIDVLSDKVTISGSTFIANAAVDTTQFSADQGGAIDSNNYQISVVNSTFFANAATANAKGGAINVDGGGIVTITNSTLLSNTAAIAANGGAFSNAGTTTLHNTLVAFNGSVNCASAVTLSGANLEFPGATCGGASIQANPLALAPANNGGPTLTSALLPGSPAINVAASDSGCPATDQRGAQRPVGAHCDIGAFEFGGQVPRLWLPLVRE
ncbi:MAG: choice-of-anchor Q domain-containing protein, partial [Anaerolineales bacterium]